jgi:TIR domain
MALLSARANPPTVFVSYTNPDKAKARRLANDLAAQGVRVWFDENSIVAGTSIPDAVQAGLTQARYLLICWSTHSAKSRWMKEEANAFLMDQLARGRKLMIPLLFQKTRLPLFLRHRKYVDFTQQWSRGYEGLRRALGFDSHPAAMPFRFGTYAVDSSVDRTGAATLRFTNEIVATAAPLYSRQIQMHTSRLPRMRSDNFRFVSEGTRRCTAQVQSSTQEHILVELKFNPPIRPGERPYRNRFRYVVERMYPASRRDVVFQRRSPRGGSTAVKNEDTYAGALLPAPAEKLVYRVSLPESVYADPVLRVTRGMSGGPYPEEWARVKATGDWTVRRREGALVCTLTIRNCMPHVWYGIGWSVR